jgi:hypothetical protein
VSPTVPTTPFWDIGQGLHYAAGEDPDCFRAFLSIVGMLQLPTEAVVDLAFSRRWWSSERSGTTSPRWAPSRDELLSVWPGETV